MLIQENISLASFSWLKVGGDAQYYCEPKSIQEVQEAVHWAEQKNIPIFVLGNGSNVVFSDQGFNGIVIHTQSFFNEFNFKNHLVICNSGSLIYKVVQESVKKGMAGIECLVGIPGTLGGAIYINAGAYGQEFSETLVSVVSCDKQGNIIERKREECKMRYRNSIFTSLNEIILEVKLNLTPYPIFKLKERMKKALSKRKKTQPLNFPNVGSIFKKSLGVSAGQHIEEAGLKGYKIGGAQISEKHANFIVNKGGATAQDVYNLVKYIQQIIFKKNKIKLELEPRFIGAF